MLEIVWHGRGGQGAFTAARLLGAAYTLQEGRYALAFPSFGPERRGAPMRAFTKLDERPISARSETESAGITVYLDATLYAESAPRAGGVILINTPGPVPGAVTVDAGALADGLGIPTPNTVMLGALTALLAAPALDEIERAIDLYMPPRLRARNKEAARAAFHTVRGGTARA
ncbi:MAG: 2-oxoacid:acceptor oxidoreductase family protein [Oscillospiraceae bacterium]|jgi:pyruvate ferredoxin oxidoreductase gamma subunit|nr:2-oxoacid:acceptor oxidoreductase family protein [Oscillospiraceae bacterium]